LRARQETGEDLRPTAIAFVALAALACWVPARATVYVVTANPDMTFTPASITIYQGDAIRFENAGGVHNVHADDNSFICSINCSTENAPSDQPWSVIVRFNQVRSIGYFCDQHGNLQGGMRGAVTVIDRVFVDGFDGTPGP
jgi:plastocyanin